MTAPSIQEQIDLEKRMVSCGIARFKSQVREAEEAGRASDTMYAQKLMKELVLPVSDKLAEFMAYTGPGRKQKYRTLLAAVNTDVAAYLALKALFNSFTRDESLVSLATHIGRLIEDEAKFKKFHEQHSDYYETLIADFKRRGTKHYGHMHRTLTMKANQKGVAWKDWLPGERAEVGMCLLDCILQSTTLVEKRQTRLPGRKIRVETSIHPTAETLDWIKRHAAFAELLNPDRLPCLIAPDPWTTLEQGGYFTPQVRSRTPLVKTRTSKHAAYLKGDLGQITEAVNILQETRWRVNKEVHDIMRDVWNQGLDIGLPQSTKYELPECPLPRDLKKQNMSPEEKKVFDEWKAEARIVHTMEKERIAKCFQVIRVLRLAQEYRDLESFWYVWQCDFRGRMYATVSAFSIQGADFAKALLEFSEGRSLTKDGVPWFLANGANLYGVDKVSFKDRIRWVKDHHDQIMDFAENPLDHREFWQEADKPWQFLAWAKEYREYSKGGAKASFVSHLYIGQDGTCNGLQNFSAMLRDEVGGKATNLLPLDLPADIYSEVALVCARKLRGMGGELAAMWVAFMDENSSGTLPRALAKKPVMTLPYGSTQQTCREAIYAFLVNEYPLYFDKHLRFRLATFLTPILWESIGEVVIAARAAMDWIQTCAGILAKAGKPVQWWTPIGFPVYQARMKMNTRRISTELCGRLRFNFSSEGSKLDTIKQKQGASPNFVHSMDACHLMKTLRLAKERGVTSFACVHDDYGTHACDIPVLRNCIREAFVDLYQNSDPLLEFKAINEELSGVSLPDPPAKGSLDLKQVLESEYFFG